MGIFKALFGSKQYENHTPIDESDLQNIRIQLLEKGDVSKEYNSVVKGYIDLENKYKQYRGSYLQVIAVIQEQTPTRVSGKIRATNRLLKAKTRSAILILGNRLCVLADTNPLLGKETKQTLSPLVIRIGAEVGSEEKELNLFS